MKSKDMFTYTYESSSRKKKRFDHNGDGISAKEKELKNLYFKVNNLPWIIMTSVALFAIVVLSIGISLLVLGENMTQGTIMIIVGGVILLLWYPFMSWIKKVLIKYHQKKIDELTEEIRKEKEGVHDNDINS